MERHLGYAMTLGDLSFIKTYLSEFTGVCPPPCVMIFDADDVTTIVDHCNHFTQPQAETAFPFQYHLPQLRWRTPQYHLPQLRCGSRCRRSTGILMFFFGKSDSGNFMQCEWDPIWAPVVSNSNGSTGWARILRSGGDDVPEGVHRRVRLCACNPCNARWLASKYGV